MHSVIYVIHVISAIIFVLLIPFPFIAMRLRKREHSSVVHSLRIWKVIMLVAHFFIIVSLISGLLMTPSFTSLWFWFVIILYLAMGAFLGITTKSVRLLIKERESAKELWDKVIRTSIILCVAIVIQFMLMT